MHQRNPYRQPLDFALLSKNYPSLRSHLIGTHAGTVTIDFKNEASLRCLTEALLQLDFGLRLSLAEDRLCPPVPNRLNYILWLQDIIDASCLDQTEPVRGIDIGTGASTIYPLIGCALNPNWFFTGTDIDTTSLAFAHRNITQNSLQHRITLLQASSSSDDPILVPFALDPNASFDFTMCNPPFYSSVEDVAKSADMKVLQPHAVCTGAEVEMITSGGEVAFVGRMVKESMKYGTRCRWYTSMLGKLSSLAAIVALLRELSIDNYGITEFVQGQTRRWAIIWSFGVTRLPDAVARLQSPNLTLQPLMPPHNTLLQSFSFTLPFSAHSFSFSDSTQQVRDREAFETHQKVIDVLQKVLSGIEGLTAELRVQRQRQSIPRRHAGQGSMVAGGENEDQEMEMGDVEERRMSWDELYVEARGDTWSRAARRNKARMVLGKPTNGGPPNTDSISSTIVIPLIRCQIRILTSSTSATDAKSSDAVAIEAHGGRRRKPKSTNANSTTSSRRGHATVECHWVYGKSTERSLFESFWSHVARKVGLELHDPR